MTQQTMALTRALAHFIVDTKDAAIPQQVCEHAKVAFMDWLGVALAGCEDPLVLKLIGYADAMGGAEQAMILGHGVKKSVSQAALINGAASHALDYDDSFINTYGHPSVGLFPGILALSEWKEKSGAEFINAYIIGLKAGAVIGACAGVEHYMNGWHATSTIGHLSSAAACARLMGLDEQQTVYALGIAGTQACGLKRVFGTMCKPFHAGRAAQAGLMAAMLARENFTSAEDILEGHDGFLQLFKGKVNEEAVATLGKTWDIENLAQKYHASCHATHSPIEGGVSLMEKENLVPEQISSITIHVSKLAIDVAGKPEPKTGLEGKFSISYCVANALLRGDTGMGAFTDERVNDPKVKAFMNKIAVVLDKKIDPIEARVTAKTNDGKEFTCVADIFKQIPPLETKRNKVRAKFMDLCGATLGAEKAKELSEAILSIEKMGNIRKFVAQVNG